MDLRLGYVNSWLANKDRAAASFPSNHSQMDRVSSDLSQGSSWRSSSLASDMSVQKACASQAPRLVSDSSMRAFDPGQYGCPTSKRTTSSPGQSSILAASPIAVHPAWNIPSQSPLIATGTSSHMTPVKAPADVNNHSAFSASAHSSSPSVRFDSKAYGDPTRNQSQQTKSISQYSNVADRRSDRSVKAATGLSDKSLDESCSTIKTNSIKAHSTPASSPPTPRCPPSDDSQTAQPQATNHASNISSAKSNAQTVATPAVPLPVNKQSVQHHDQTPPASSWNEIPAYVRSTPRVETYETLKKEGETPLQLVARLQVEGLRKVSNGIKRKKDSELGNTALSLLDVLRQPLPSENTSNGGTAPRLAPAAVTQGLDTTSSLPADAWSKQLEEKSASAVEPSSSRNQSNGQSKLATGRMNLPNADPNGSQKIDASNMVLPKSNRWAATADMKAPVVKPNSNAEGSDPESDMNSTRANAASHGRLIRSRKPPVGEAKLQGWDGKMQPPPTDWEQRPQFYNNTPEYIHGFDGWIGDNVERTMTQKPEAKLDFGAIPLDRVQNLDNHPDGIGFVRKETMVGPSNAERYGHKIANGLPLDTTSAPADFEGDAVLDFTDPDNCRHKDETAQMFIDRHMAHMERAQKDAKAQAELQKKLLEREQQAAAENSSEVPPVEDDVKRAPPPPFMKNIYLRPAVRSDLAGMLAIYNWYIEHSVRPSELSAITIEDMESRLDMSQSARLPVIVAVERTRNKNASRSKPANMPRRVVNPNHPIQNIDPSYRGVVKDEHVAGWASATDWSASDYVETTTAELEVYVAHDFRKSGVGRCLMDQLLDATDRGHTKRGGFDFHIAPEVRHMYSGGGGRDLHKLIFQVRTFNRPMTPQQYDRIKRTSQQDWGRRGFRYNDHIDDLTSPKKDYSKAAMIDDREDDYTVWLKDWLYSFDFEEEAYLKKLGTRDRRFVDVRYLTRETCWQPAEHRIPDFSNGV